MANRSEEIFEDWFRRYWIGVLGVIHRLIGDADEAEDLALEVFWKLYTTPPQADNELAVKAWLYRVATNEGYNAIRARQRRQRYEFEQGFIDLDHDRSSDPSTETQRKEDQALVRGVLGSMKKRQAQLLALRYSGFSYAEIAAALDVSKASVGTMLTRAETEFERRYRKLEGTRNDSFNR
jgi:RNA polymerase sigma factor (sigma-70 family)